VAIAADLVVVVGQLEPPDIQWVAVALEHLGKATLEA
jgi:hypothetical protein